MHNIHLIFTRHQPVGNCNSQILLKIIDDLSPEIIFEELEESIHNRIYNENIQTTLETDAIKEYLCKHDIPHIPVDTLVRPENFHQDCQRMRGKISGMACQDAFDYRNYLEYQISVVSKYGFDYLNSDHNDRLLREIDAKKELVLNTINDPNLHRISAIEREIIEKREGEILNNIYRYCKDHSFNRAVLLIGSGHRNSIIRKVNERNNIENIKVNWQFLKN